MPCALVHVCRHLCSHYEWVTPPAFLYHSTKKILNAPSASPHYCPVCFPLCVSVSFKNVICITSMAIMNTWHIHCTNLTSTFLYNNTQFSTFSNKKYRVEFYQNWISHLSFDNLRIPGDTIILRSPEDKSCSCIISDSLCLWERSLTPSFPLTWTTAILLNTSRFLASSLSKMLTLVY